MIARLFSLVLLVSLLASPLAAKDKKASSLPEYVLRARTVLVVIDPDAGEPLDQPRANETARDTVERALTQWGRFNLVMDGAESDLVIVVRTGDGRAGRPTVKGGPIDNRSGVMQPGDGSIRIGAQRGQPPPLTDPSMDPQNRDPQNRAPRVGSEVGASEDSFLVYLGGTQYPLDSPPVWRYAAKDCLRQPTVAAVEEFRKAVADAEKPPTKKGP
jgi:hypothetical protein